MKPTKLSALEEFMYIISCLFTFGTTWLLKIVIKKAIIEANNESKK